MKYFEIEKQLLLFYNINVIIFFQVPGAAAALRGDHLTSVEDYMETLGEELATSVRATVLHSLALLIVL